MKNIEPGCICRIINCKPNSPNYGKIVTAVKFIGTVKGWGKLPIWEVDQLMLVTYKITNKTKMLNMAPEKCLQRIDDGELGDAEQGTTDYLLSGVNGDRLKESIKQIEEV